MNLIEQIKVNDVSIDGYQGTFYSENPEWVKVIVDSENKVLAGIKSDGTVEWSVGVPTPIREFVTKQVLLSLEEELDLKVDKEENKSLIDSSVAESMISAVNPEYLQVITDIEDKIVMSIKNDGAVYIPILENDSIDLKVNDAIEKIDASVNEVLSNIGAVADYFFEIDDPERRSELKTDSEDKIISYRDDDGILHENVGIETNSLQFTEDGMTEFLLTLIESGFNPKSIIDWSDEEFVEIPLPLTCAVINFGVDSQATSKSGRYDYQEGVNGDIPTTIEFWDMLGNYFKKPILLSAQGSSSMGFWIKNQGFDLDDGSSIKFGSWVSQDSFHVKKYYIDAFRGLCIVGYWLTEQVYQTRLYGERRPWDYLNTGTTTQNGIGKFNKDFDTGALAHPDGFPVHVFFNGKDAGIYAFNLKKHRDNYYMDKKNTSNVHIEGANNDGIKDNTLFGGIINWEAIEVRNPKPKKKNDGWDLVDVDGNKYDGDFPKELMGTDTPGYDSTNTSHVKSALTKAVIELLSGFNAEINTSKTKETFERYFNVPFFIDYFIISQVIWNEDGFGKNWQWGTWDGIKWCPMLYDLDSIFGMTADGTRIVPAIDGVPLSLQVNAWTNTKCLIGVNNVANTPVTVLWELYQADIRLRYKELRDLEIISTNNIVRLLERWLEKCGYDNLKTDIENICSYNDVPQTPSYRDGSETYEQVPTTGGFYNSIMRVKMWLDEHIEWLDGEDIFNYNR